MVRWWAGSGVRLTYHFIQWCAGGRVLVHLSSLHHGVLVDWVLAHLSSIHPLLRWWMGSDPLVIHSSFMVRGWIGWLVGWFWFTYHPWSILLGPGWGLLVELEMGPQRARRVWLLRVFVAFVLRRQWRREMREREREREKERDRRSRDGWLRVSFFLLRLRREEIPHEQ